MKKTLWMLGVAVAALTSCTESEVLDIPESRTIQFEPFVDKPTRAIYNLTTSEFNVFHVSADRGITANTGIFTADDGGSDFFDMVSVARAKTDAGSWGPWDYSPAKPWTLDKTYRFAAYANGYASNLESESIGATKLTGVTYESKMTGKVSMDETAAGLPITETWGLEFDNVAVGNNDLIVSVPDEVIRTSTAQLSNAVHLNFKHMFAKVIFRFKLDQVTGSGLTAKVHPFSMSAIKTSDCSVYNNRLITGNEINRTEIAWASQDKKASLAIATVPTQEEEVAGKWQLNTSSMTVGEYEIIEEGYEVSLEESNGDNADGVENIVEKVFFVIPQNNDIKVSFTAESYKDGNMTGRTEFSNISLAIADHELWKPGFVYRYTANMSAEVNHIDFTADVQIWSDTPVRDQAMVGTNN